MKRWSIALIDATRWTDGQTTMIATILCPRKPASLRFPTARDNSPPATGRRWWSNDRQCCHRGKRLTLYWGKQSIAQMLGVVNDYEKIVKNSVMLSTLVEDRLIKRLKRLGYEAVLCGASL